MIERSTRLVVKHHKSGKPFSELQKLNLYYQMQRRPLLGAKSNLEHAIYENPTIKMQLWDAARSVSAALDALANEYQRDHDALTKHTVEN